MFLSTRVFNFQINHYLLQFVNTYLGKKNKNKNNHCFLFEGGGSRYRSLGQTQSSVGQATCVKHIFQDSREK